MQPGGAMNFPQGGMQMGGMPNMMPMQQGMQQQGMQQQGMQQQGMQNFGQFNQMPQQQRGGAPQQNFFPMGGNPSGGFNQPTGSFNNQQGFQQIGKLS
jgi:RIMS-binding protein 2